MNIPIGERKRVLNKSLFMFKPYHILGQKSRCRFSLMMVMIRSGFAIPTCGTEFISSQIKELKEFIMAYIISQIHKSLINSLNNPNILFLSGMGRKGWQPFSTKGLNSRAHTIEEVFFLRTYMGAFRKLEPKKSPITRRVLYMA